MNKRLYISFILFMVLLLLVDSIWVVGGRSIHTDVISRVQKSKPVINIPAALMFYLIAPLGYVFIIKRLSRTYFDVFLYGLLVGLLMYGTFDITNKAIFKDYPWYYTIADASWGTLCMGVVSLFVFCIESKF